MNAWGSSWGNSWGVSWGASQSVSQATSGGGRKRKLRILPDGTRLYATEREIRQILSMFYQPKPVEKLPPKLRIRQTETNVDLIKFDKYIPKTYELKPAFKRVIQADYIQFIESMRIREEEEFFSMILEAL